jgi:mannose-6-phosphate isomerase-like protein (cupin superfamily)
VYRRPPPRPLVASFAVQHWDLTAIEAPDGTRDPAVLHTSDGARAVLILLHPGQALRDHEVTERAWLWVVEGSIEIEAGGERTEAGAGTLATFAPAERHAIRSSGGARILLLLAPWPGVGHYRGGDGPRESAASEA